MTFLPQLNLLMDYKVHKSACFLHFNYSSYSKKPSNFHSSQLNGFIIYFNHNHLYFTFKYHNHLAEKLIYTIFIYET